MPPGKEKGVAMDAATRAEFQVEGHWAMARRHRIRWIQCDIYAHINHAAYFTMFEDMRIDWWLASGGRFGADAEGPVVASIEAKYLRPGHFNEDVLLTVRATSFRRSSFIHEYGLWRDGLLCSGRAVCVIVNNATGAKAPISDALRQLMLTRDQAIAEI
ncbi:MAG: acyl-CoA thioesterase [Alphaproteobacteria bacterium]|nr:acyl-CoA thioesterase [Alphaproteobacteria bacterium]